MNFLQSLSLANELHPVVIGLFAFALGAGLGSFLNVVIYRLPVMIQGVATPPFNLAIPASRCPGCKSQIKPWQNIPILSYLALRGKCFHCEARISFRYPLIEIFGGILTLFLWVAYGPTLFFLAATTLALSLLALAIIDHDTQLLPDKITIPLIFIGLALSFYEVTETDFYLSITGAGIGYGLIWLTNVTFKKIKGEDGIGGGDMKLIAAGGSWLGVAPLFEMIFVAAIIAIVPAIFIRKKSREIPFGPYLCISFFLLFILQREGLSIPL
jgi:leader peptidase (prepilin peptidase)/N-methyltransferase